MVVLAQQRYGVVQTVLVVHPICVCVEEVRLEDLQHGAAHLGVLHRQSIEVARGEEQGELKRSVTISQRLVVQVLHGLAVNKDMRYRFLIF